MGTVALSRFALQPHCHVGRRLVFGSRGGTTGFLIAAAVVIAAAGCARVRMLPAPWNWVPRPPGAELVIDRQGEEGGGAALFGHYVTTDPPATVLDYYEHAFQRSGLTVERSEEALTARAGEGDRAVIVQTLRGYTGETIVGINALMRTAPPPTNSVRAEKLPDWVPTFPGSAPQAKQEEGPTNEIKRAHFETDAAPADVIAFYRKILGGAGFWLEHGGAGSENTTLNASSDDYMRFVSVVAGPTREGHTRVQLAFRESSDPRGPKQAAKLPTWAPVYPDVEIFEDPGYRSESSGRGYFVTADPGPTVLDRFGKILRERGFRVAVKLSQAGDPKWGGRIQATAREGRQELVADVRPDPRRNWRSNVDISWMERETVPPTPSARQEPVKWVGQPPRGALATWVPTYPEERTTTGGSRYEVYPDRGSIGFFTLDNLDTVLRHYKAALMASGFDVRVMPIREAGRLMEFGLTASGRGDRRFVKVSGSFISRVGANVSEIYVKFGSNEPSAGRK